jgi:hypothetical protein
LVDLDINEKVILKCCWDNNVCGRLRLKCYDTRAETRFRLSAKWTSPFKSAGVSVQSTTGSRDVRISGSNDCNAGYTMFRGSVKSTGYPFHSSVPPSLPPGASPCAITFQMESTKFQTELNGLKEIFLEFLDSEKF